MRKLHKFINEDLNAALVEPQSEASMEAQKLGLQYVGFGRYEDPNSQQITHVVQNDKLVPFKSAMKSNAYKQTGQDDYGSYFQQFGKEIQQQNAFLTQYYSPDNFDNKELDAIYSFTDTDFFDINDKLYTLPTGIPADQIQPDSIADTLPNKIAMMDSALSKIGAPQDFLSYVGLGTEYDITNFVPGSAFTFKGYRSTTIDPNVALNYNSRVNKTAMRQQTVMLQVRVKKGHPGLYAEDFSANPGESEFILPRATKIKVISGPNKLVGTTGMSPGKNLEVLYFECETI